MTTRNRPSPQDQDGLTPVVTNRLIVDLFAGPGGWSEGLRRLDLSDVGIEWDDAACRTRKAAGHLTIRADVASYPVEPFVGKTWGLIASPPCQDFSLAGKGAGVAGARGELVWQVLRWADALRPTWIACEQVPPVLPLWRAIADVFRCVGYRTWTGILNAADYGVPQTRKRAFLLARLDGPVVPPLPTHSANAAEGLWGSLEPWVTMAQALGWDGSLRHVRGAGMVERHGPRPDRETSAPSFAVTSKARSWVLRRPATTVCADARIFPPDYRGGRRAYERGLGDDASQRAGTDSIKVTPAEASVLQSFPADYPWQGSRSKQFEQIGNAVPPLLAAHVLSAVTGLLIAGEVAA